MNNNEKIEQVEQVEQDEELDLDVKRVKSFKTDVKAGLADRVITQDVIRTRFE